ncbi:hypothetical protein P167DRAFT_486492 [Morchella conica CCBAS932]|uniref:DUF218 domain-containing protein n=1 Tax=Morchella conica CCBAS932 TaxID=1392247 RepID=A0A3N4KVX9_9PEZI|nr:hypothetical protein P167DRAFT_486492 [Morchella conica CCBAS932]
MGVGQRRAINDFQKGETRTFIKHIEAGVSIALQNPETLLVFSGGETKASTGPRSEGSSYFNLAAARDLIPADLLARTTTEESAMDSYQNVLFSISRFHEVTGTYPKTIIVISHEFKRERFQRLHREAIQFPEEAFTFVGIDPDWADETNTNKASILEHEESTRAAWGVDLYACVEDDELREKRRGRNPMRRYNAYSISCPELVGLFRWCGLDEGTGITTRLYPGKLPWLD